MLFVCRRPTVYRRNWPLSVGSVKKASPYVVLRVAEAISIDVGRCISRMDPEVAEKLMISAGDAIEIFGLVLNLTLNHEGGPFLFCQ